MTIRPIGVIELGVDVVEDKASSVRRRDPRFFRRGRVPRRGIRRRLLSLELFDMGVDLGV